MALLTALLLGSLVYGILLKLKTTTKKLQTIEVTLTTFSFAVCLVVHLTLIVLGITFKKE